LYSIFTEADKFNHLLPAYPPQEAVKSISIDTHHHTKEIAAKEAVDAKLTPVPEDSLTVDNDNSSHIVSPSEQVNNASIQPSSTTSTAVNVNQLTRLKKPVLNSRSELIKIPRLGLNTAILVLNRYCAKLPSDTFTRLTPIWTVQR
jgi:hypothetical protein